MPMLSNLIELDKFLMLHLNAGEYHNAIGDEIMWFTSQTWTWGLLFTTLLLSLITEQKKKSIPIIFCIIITILLCDQISSGLLKPLVGRLRPSHDDSISYLLSYVHDYKGGQYGFPSSHAANTFGIAMFISLVYRNKLISTTFFLWAILCSYSRIYLGVHYPFDILTGCLIGLSIGLISYKAYKKYSNTIIAFNESAAILITLSFIISLSIFILISSVMIPQLS